MPKKVAVGYLCEYLGGMARSHGLRSLSMWLKLASNEAYSHNLQMEAAADHRIGVWDWDVGRNVNYVNDIGAEFFGKSEKIASSGVPIEAYTSMVHPDDLGHFNMALGKSISEGGSFYSEYRVLVGGQVRWLRADGNCALDPSGRPLRMLGSMIDITREKNSQTSVPLF